MTRPMSLPVLDEAATALRTTGHFAARLGAHELKDIILTLVDQVLAEYRQVQAEVQALDVGIVHSVGQSTGLVRVLRPVSAIVMLALALGNDPNPARIRLLDLSMKTDGNILAKAALGAFNIESRAREALSNPNGALAEALIPELGVRGAQLKSLGLHFEEQVLEVRMAGAAL